MKYSSWKSRLMMLLLAVVSIVAAFYVFCWVLSLGAAQIFNAVAEHRRLFPGRVTVDAISANVLGQVSFQNLIWTRDDGTLLAKIPDGTVRLRVWDVVTRNIGTKTVSEANFNNAYIHVFLDDEQRSLDVTEAPEEGEKDTIRIRGADANRYFNCQLKLDNCSLEIDTPDRHFAVEHVHLNAKLNTRRDLMLDFDAGPFTGSCAAKEIRIDGRLDLAKEEPEFDMTLFVDGCRPSSLGVGADINDPATLNARITGPLEEPIIDGDLSAPTLTFPGIVFENVKGTLHYQDGILKVAPVTAKAYKGNVEADGTFNLDEKTYVAHIKGHNLDGQAASQDKRLSVKVELDLTLRGTKEGQKVNGSFQSGEGRYSILPFKKITGKFDRRDGVLGFYDVAISLALGEVSADAFYIRKGRVEMGNIYLTDALSGEREQIL